MTYKDEGGRTKTTSFTIAAAGGDKYTMTGIFGSKKAYDLFFESDGCGVYVPLERSESNGYYVSYFGSNVGDCRVAFSFDAEGRLVADNYFSYTPDFRNWTDAFDAVATKQGADGISNAIVNRESSKSPSYDLQGRVYPEHQSKGSAVGRTGIVIRDGRKQYVK